MDLPVAQAPASPAAPVRGRAQELQALAVQLRDWFAPAVLLVAGREAEALVAALRSSGISARLADDVSSTSGSQGAECGPRSGQAPAELAPGWAREAHDGVGVLLARAPAPAADDLAVLRSLAQAASRVLVLPPEAQAAEQVAAWLEAAAAAGLHPSAGLDASAVGAGAFLTGREPDAAVPPGLLAQLLWTRTRLAASETATARAWHRGRVARARMLTAEAAASRMFRQLAEANWQHSKVITMLREEGIATMADTVSAQLGGRARGMIEQLARKQERTALELVRLNERNEWHEADLARLRHHLDNLPVRVALGKLLAAGLRRLPRPLGQALSKGLQLAWWTATFRLGTRLAERAERRRLADIVRASPHFDAAWYVGQHPELAASGSDPALHYLLVGVTNRFDPSPGFGTREYLRDHPEVQAAGTNPLVHLAGTPSATP